MGDSASNEKDRLESLRERLYARDGTKSQVKRTKLTQKPPSASIPKDWKASPRSAATMQRSAERPRVQNVPDIPREEISQTSPATNTPRVDTTYMSRRNIFKNYRIKLLLGGLVFFAIALLAGSAVLLWGNNSISGENISINVSGPFAVGGGEEIPLQIAISNQNTVSIESATLIIEYPPGTQSKDGTGTEVFTERRPLDIIDAGSVQNISAGAIVFGEENSEKVITVSVEYRVQGSNATFYKEAEPFRFKISSSPVVLDVSTVKSISSGQEAKIELMVSSNSPTPLQNVLIKANYPFGFDFTTADPSPDGGKDTWLIKNLQPGEKKTITITGVLSGQQDEQRVFDFSVGVPNERDQLALSSVFTTGKAEVAIEAPFLGVGVDVNGNSADTITVKGGEPASVRVTFKNTLQDTVYDGNITVQLSGNALGGLEVDAQDGFFNSSSNTITFDSVGATALKEMAPGDSSSVLFTLRTQENTTRTPEVKLLVTIKGKRVFEDRVPEELVATASRTIRTEGQLSLLSSVTHSAGAFSNSGPTPPTVGETTEYTLQFEAHSGSNDVSGAQMTAVLPQYVAWLGNVTSGDDVSYEPSTRTMVWNIGSIGGNKSASMSAQVAITPSASQVGKVPLLAEAQSFRATDSFTGTVVRDEASALTTAIDGDNAVGRIIAP